MPHKTQNAPCTSADDPLSPQERSLHDDVLAYEDYTQWVTRCPRIQKALLDAYVQTKREHLGLTR